MYQYLEASTTIIQSEKELTLQRFKLFSSNILAYGVLKNKDVISEDLTKFYQMFTF